MDLKQVRYFVAACEEGSISAAAQRLHCTPSGVSQQMSALENRLGTILLERTRRGVVPTPAGKRFYESCLGILRAVSGAKIDLEDFDAAITGSISAGFAPGLVRCILPQALARFTREFPKVDISIGSGTADDLIDGTSSGALDFYVGQLAQSQLGLTDRPMGRYPVALISGARRGFHRMKPLRLNEVGPLKLTLPSATNSLRPKILDAIRHDDIDVERTVSIASLGAGLEFLSQTDWSTILPFWVGLNQMNNELLTVNPIADPQLHLELDFVHPSRQPLNKPSQTLYSYFLQELESSLAEWRRITDSDVSNS